jgi:peroxiredoxin
MRIRVMVLALLTVAVCACAAPRDGGGQQPAATAPATTTATQAAGSSKSQAKYPPPGMVAPARRRPAPALRVTAFDGQTVSLDGFRGRPAVVNFFESWCGICQVEQPDLSKVAADYAGKAGFVGISYHDTVAAGRAYQRRFDVSYPLANDPSGRTWVRWGVPYQPVTVLVDKQGRLAERYEGGTTGGTLRVALAYLIDE